MIRKRHILFISFIFGAFIQNGYAQVTSIKANIDSTELIIGDQSILSFEWEQHPNQTVVPPIFSDTITQFLEITEKPTSDTVKINQEVIKIELKYIITSFEDTLIYIRPMPFIVNKDDTIWSNALSLKIIQPFELDSTKNQLTDIKPIYSPPFDWKNFIKKTFLVLFILILLAILIILIRKYILNKKQGQPIKSTKKPILSAYNEAIYNLNELKSKKLWQKGKVKTYHTELTDILRIYIDRTFQIHSMEMTSGEILDSLQKLKTNENRIVFDKLQQILKLADLVKFARYTPIHIDNEQSLSHAYNFVEEIEKEQEKKRNVDNNQSKNKNDI